MLGNFKVRPDRQKLGFKEAVISSFAFLRSYGLRPVQQDVTFVRYESVTVFLNVYHGRGSYEIGVEIGRLDGPEKYALGYIVSWAGKWEHEGFGKHTMFQVSSREGVQEFVPKVAELVRKYGEPFLRGETAFYDKLREANRRASLEFTKQQMIEGIRKKAEAAWHEKDYTQVAELYGRMRDELSEVESRRLNYAEHRS